MVAVAGGVGDEAWTAMDRRTEYPIRLSVTVEWSSYSVSVYVCHCHNPQHTGWTMARRRHYGSADNNNEEGEEQHLLDTAYCDHYSSQHSNVVDNDNDDGGRSNRHSATTSTTFKRRSNSTRRSPLVIVIIILLLTIGAVYFSYIQLQQQLTSLSAQMQLATSNISHLDSDLTLEFAQLHQINDTLTNHSKVISRFANSVSNSDVLEKLQELEMESKEREERVVEEMDNTKKEIRGVLMKTKTEIDETVR
jgi:type II secretory pathway pseudopilin PulG